MTCKISDKKTLNGFHRVSIISQLQKINIYIFPTPWFHKYTNFDQPYTDFWMNDVESHFYSIKRYAYPQSTVYEIFVGKIYFSESL